MFCGNIGNSLQRSRYDLLFIDLTWVTFFVIQPSKVEYITLKKDACEEVSLKMVPDNVLANVYSL